MRLIERLPGLITKVPILFLFMVLPAPAFGQQRFGGIGDLALVSGEVLRECRVGYRIFGRLNAEESNIVVYPTWANGRTEQMEDGMTWLSDAGYYVIVNENTTREQVFTEIAKSRDHYNGPDANNKTRQAEAMMTMDDSDVSGVKAKMFIAVSKSDHTVTPGPALEFADKIGAEPFIFDNACGRSLHLCPDNGMNRAILEFLEP